MKPFIVPEMTFKDSSRSLTVAQFMRPRITAVTVWLYHITLFTKAWQIQNIDISVRKEKNMYKQKINRCKIILTTVN